MNEEEKKIEGKILPWRLSLTAVLSLFLIVTFAMYLPLRFRYNVLTESHKEEHMSGLAMDAGHDDAGGVMGHDEHGDAAYHEEIDVREGLSVNLNLSPLPVVAGTTTWLDLFVNIRPDNIPVTDLEIEHEKIMHVIGLRSDMNEFFHIHPDVTDIPGLMRVEHTFAEPGLYKVWSEVRQGGITHTFGHPEFEVAGEGVKYKKEVSFGTSVIAGNYQVVLHHDALAKGRAYELRFEIHDAAGRDAELENYLGVPMHLAVIKDDLKQFIHTHPVGADGSHTHSSLSVPSLLSSVLLAHGGEEDGHEEAVVESAHGVLFEVTFPEAGVYRVFAQFRPAGADLPPDEALIASFWLEIAEKPPLAVSPWWINLAWSSVLIVILSVWVKKYLIVKS